MTSVMSDQPHRKKLQVENLEKKKWIPARLSWQQKQKTENLKNSKQ